MTSTHFLSIGPVEFRAIALGQQRALCLSKDEQVEVGDQLVLREWRASEATLRGPGGSYSGVWTMRKVTAATEGPGVEASHAMYSFNASVDNERATVVLKRQLGLAEQQGTEPDRFFRHLERRERARRAVLRASAARVRSVRAASASGAPR